MVGELAGEGEGGWIKTQQDRRGRDGHPHRAIEETVHL